jgi:aldehyde:ferredoxin oxidoreductase
MTLQKGYAENVVRVNLTTGTISNEALREDVAQSFIGARGMGVRLSVIIFTSMGCKKG